MTVTSLTGWSSCWTRAATAGIRSTAAETIKELARSSTAATTFGAVAVPPVLPELAWLPGGPKDCAEESPSLEP